MTETTRRAVLTSAAGVGTAAILSACGGGDDSATPGTGAGANGAGTTGTQTGAPAGGGGTGSGLAKTADIPVGGGRIFASEGVVITQPVAGTFKGFTAACTHQGCTVSAVRDGVIRCACHGSEFSAADGSVKAGPATRPLPAKDLKVEGDAISLA